MKILLCISAVAAMLSLAAAEPRGVWRIEHLDGRTLALTGDYTGFLRERYAAEKLEALKELCRQPSPEWKRTFGLNFSAAEVIGRYRPEIAGMLQQFDRIRVTDAAGSAHAVEKAGYWLNPTGAARFPDGNGRERLTRNADVAHFVFLRFAEPLAPGAGYVISLPTGETLAYRFDPDNVPSLLFKQNQLGYAPQARRKYAYLGAWLGDAGPLPMKEYIGRSFELCDAGTGSAVFSGPVAARMEDPVSPQGTPFTGEETAELDFSSVSAPGTYFLRVPGIGRSPDFRIDGRSIADAFYIHARGLYHKRCGIAKEKPYTNWTTPLCHREVLRGTFPPDDGQYNAAPKGKTRDWGFFDSHGNSISVKHFNLIAENLPADPEPLFLPGGWHDAADFDRRPCHLSIVGDLAAAYLLKPENFSDGQLDLPESGNGVPDILDEARWGLEHLRLAQQPDGGVGTWIETDHHPTPAEYLLSSPQKPFRLSLATRAGTLEYAAYASMLALALRQAGDAAGSELCRESARRAWEYALNPANRKIQYYSYYLDKRKQMISYREPKELPAEFLLKAGANLRLLYGDAAYLEPLAGRGKELADLIRRESWRWSPFLFVELEVFRDRLEEFGELRRFWTGRVVQEAREMAGQIDGGYPYRIAWYGARNWKAGRMSWGNCHPLRRALTLLAAYAYSGEKSFLDAAYLCNDFHNGANPNGTTMTSGLGYRCPVRFLDFTSYADGIAEFVPGITPYRNTYGIARDDVRLAHGLYYGKRPEAGFAGISKSLLPLSLRGGRELAEDESAKLLSRAWPIWRRWANVEPYSVAASEYTVWETIAPAAAATGLLLDRAYPPEPGAKERVPAADITQLPGYAPLP